MEPLPLHAIDLVEQLDKAIPERCPDPKMSERDIWIYVGKRLLVQSLLARKAFTEENP